MTSLKYCLIIVVMVCIFFSCNKDDITIEKSILLEISEGQTSYIGPTGNYFYTNDFSNKNDTQTYRLKVKAGLKYHLICTQPNQVQVWMTMALSNSKGEVIKRSETYQGKPVNDKPDIIFTAVDNDELFLKVTNYGLYSQSLNYNLYFQKCETTNLNIRGYNWASSGNWKIINPEILEFTCTDSREFRWIRLDSDIPDNIGMSFTVKSTTKTELPTFGFIYQGSTELSNWGDYNEELPATGRFYNFYESNIIRTIDLYGESASFNYQEVDLQNIEIKKGINFHISPTQVIVNNTLILQGINLGVKKTFYFVIEDDGFDKITFENFQLK
jgi:hypothetical protein